jgi:flagellar biosynthesis protein FlhA
MYQSPEGDIAVLTLDQDIEKTITDGLQQSDHGRFLPIDPTLAQGIISSISQNVEKFSQLNRQPVVLCSPQIRPHFKKLIERFVPDLAVLSYNEVVSSAKIQSIGTVKVEHAD